MPSLDQVLTPVRAVPPGRRALAARMLLQLERRLASAAAYLHPRCRPRPGEETLDDQDRLLATWLAAYYAGVGATPDVLRGDLLEPLVARSGCAEPFVGPAAAATTGGGAGDAGALRFGVPSKPEARCDSRSELLRAAAAAVVALHAYLNYPRGRGADALAPDETVVALSTLVIKSLLPPPPPSAPPSVSSAVAADGADKGSGEAQAAERGQEAAEAAVRALDAGLADLGRLPSCRAILAGAGLALRSPAGAAAAAGGGGGGDAKAATGAAAAAAADAELEAEEAADADAAAAADAARAAPASAPAPAAAAADEDNGRNGGFDARAAAPPLPGVPPLAPGACAASHAQLEGGPHLTTARVRWLMHWARGRALASMADVALAVDPDGDGPRRAPGLLAAAQRDALGMVSALPAHPAGYSLFAALAMRGQQFPAAVPFLRRGLAVARAARDDAAVARMCPQLAAALLLGGGGRAPAAEAADPPSSSGKLLPVDLGDVLALLDAGDAAAAACAAWWPGAAFGACPGDGEPERSVVWAKLLPAVAAREGVAAANAFACGGGGGGAEEEERGDAEAEEAAAAALARFLAETGAVAPLEGLAWVAAPPRSVPPGAVVVDVDGGGDGGGLAAVVEEEEEEPAETFREGGGGGGAEGQAAPTKKKAAVAAAAAGGARTSSVAAKAGGAKKKAAAASKK